MPTAVSDQAAIRVSLTRTLCWLLPDAKARARDGGEQMRKISRGIVAVTLSLSGCAIDIIDSEAPIARDEARDRAGGPSGLAPSDLNDQLAPGVDAPPAEPAPAPVILPPWDDSTIFAGLRDGRVAGDFGPIVGVNLATDITHVYDDGYFTQIDVYAVRDDGQRVMLQLQVESYQGPFFVPGIGKRMRNGFGDGGYAWALGCAGPDGGSDVQPFMDTPYDEEACDIAIDTEQNTDDPTALSVVLHATFRDGDGECPDMPSDGDMDLPDEDGDGDGDLPADGLPPADDPASPLGPGGGGGPLATSSFTLTP
jgi:hypothetical protein